MVDEELTAFALPGDLDTPCVVVDLDRLEANLVRMQAAMDAAGVALRPHNKTAKSLEVARRAIAAGARGLTVATIGEAAVFAEGGFDDLFVAYPLWMDRSKGARLRDLLEVATVRVGVDSPQGAEALAAAVAGGPRPEVLVEVDCGEGRTGVAPDEAGRLGRAVLDAGLALVGVYTHGGHGYDHPGAGEAAGRDEVEALATARDALRAEGIEVEVLSAGSTPTALHSARPPVTEQRPGTYVFGDRHQAHLGSVEPGQHALVVAATVVSTPRPGHVVLDSGAKALAKDRAPYVDGHGTIPALAGSTITTLHDHHALVVLADGGATPAIGEQVAVIPNHVCPVVNLTDRYIVVRNGTEVDRWPVDARGRM